MASYSIYGYLLIMSAFLKQKGASIMHV